MNIFESDYWRITVFVQKHIGLWLFEEKPWKTYVAWIYVYGFIISFMVPAGIRWYNELGVNIEIVIENAIGEMYLILVLFALTCHIIYKKKLKYLYESVANDWKTMVKAEELKIMHKYAAVSKRIALYYSGYMVIGTMLFSSMPLFYPVFDIIMPMRNTTRPKDLPYYAEYGVDIDKYFYPLMAHVFFGGLVTVALFVTYDTGFMLIVQHLVSLFELVNLWLSKASEIAGTERNFKNIANTNITAHRHIIKAIKLHQKAIVYVAVVQECYHFTWLIVLTANTVMMGCGIVVVLMKLDRPEEVLRYVVALCAYFIHFYYIFLPGQKIINASASVFNHCYSCNWYNLSKKSKSLIKFMMMRSLIGSELTGGNVFILCMETYYKMMKFGFTIFTVINSMKFSSINK